MAKQLQLRRGTTSQHSSFTGLVGEVTVDTDKDTAVVHDGSTAGGKPLATETGSQTLTNKTLTSPVLNTGVSGTAVKDQDDMSSNSATHVATQQSIKAYVDAQTHEAGDVTSVVAGAGMTGGGTTGDVTLNVIGGTGITAGNDEITVDATIATLTGSQTLTNKTLTSPVLTTPNSGTPSALVGTNISGTAANLTAGAVTTNANLTGEVTSSGNATTIVDDKVDEANLKISNAGTNGQFLSKQSGNTGGLTWATVADPTSGISDGNFLEANANIVDNDFLRVDGTEIEGRSATEVLSDLGSGTPGSGNFLRGDGSWQTAGSTDASTLTSGTLPMARLSGTLPALNGSALTNLPAGGDVVKIAGAAFTAVTSIDLQGCFTSAYKHYKLYFMGYRVSSGRAVCQYLKSDNSVEDTSNSYYYRYSYQENHDSQTTGDTFGDNWIGELDWPDETLHKHYEGRTDYMRFGWSANGGTGAGGGTGTGGTSADADVGSTMEATIYDPLATSRNIIEFNQTFVNSMYVGMIYGGMVCHHDNTSFTGLRIKSSSGAFDAVGHYALFGYKVH